MRRNQQAYNPIDQIFSQKLSGHSSAFSPKIWENIQADLIAQNGGKKRAAWIIWLLGAILIFASIAALLIQGNGDNFNTPHSSNQFILTQNDQAEEGESQKSFNNATSILSEDNTNTEEETALASSDISFTGETKKSLIENKTEISSNQTNKLHKELAELADLAIESFEEVSSKQNFESTSLQTMLPSRKMVFFDPLPGTTGNNFISSVSAVLLPTLFAKKIDPSDCPDFSSRTKGEMSMDVYYSSDFPLRTLAPINSEFDGYAFARDETETELYSFSLGVRAAYHVSPSIAIRAGLHYSQINERFNFEDPNSQQVKTIITIDSSFINGMWEITRDTQRVNLTGVSEIQHYNRYRMLDIPILLSYEYVTDKFDLSVNGGVMLNLLFKKKGRFLDANLMPASFDSGDPSQFNAFKKNIGLSIYGSFTFAYKLNPQWSILIEPNMRHYVNQVSLNSYPLKQSYTTIGVATGVRYHF
jgi:hypothetical protein